MVFSNKVVNILLILRLSAKKELCRSKALFSYFLLGFKLDFLFGLLGIKHLHKVQKNEITDEERGDIPYIIGSNQEPLGSIGRQSPKEDVIIKA